MSPKRSTFRTGRRSRSRAEQEGGHLVSAQAASWLAGHDRGLSCGDGRAFRHWLAANGCHRQAWLEAQLLWGRLDLLARGPSRRRLARTLPPRVRSVLPKTAPDG